MFEFEKNETEARRYCKPITAEIFEEFKRSGLVDPEKTLESWKNRLDELLENISEKTNEEYKVAVNEEKKECETKLVNPDCTIRINSHRKKEGGQYKNEELRKDKEYIKKLEKEWDEEREEEGIEKDKYGNLVEKTTIIILDKIIGEKFIVVRASRYDDCINGVDTVIVDKESGNVVCAIDEVKARKATEKFKKVRKKNSEGGATIKYGITVDDGKLIKKSIENIPIFYFRVSGKDLVNILKEMMKPDNSEEPSKIELKVFSRLIDSFKNQFRELENKNIIEDENKEGVEAMRTNAEKFKGSLNKMDELRKDFNANK